MAPSSFGYWVLLFDRDTMNTDKLLTAIESAKSRILANISRKTLEEITNAAKKEMAKKSKRDCPTKLRDPDGRA